MRENDEFSQTVTLNGHPLGDLKITIFADRVVVRQDTMKVTVPLTQAALDKINERIQTMEDARASTAH